MKKADVQFKAKADTALFDESPILEAVIIPNGWEIMPGVDSDYPYDGQPVWITEDGINAHPATWRTTRVYDAFNMKWVLDSYWARRNSGGQRIDIAPIAYKKLED